MEVRDLQLVLEKQWAIKIPGIGPSRPQVKVPLYVRPPPGSNLMALVNKEPAKKKSKAAAR